MLFFALNLILRVATFYTPILDVDETQFAGFAHVLMDGGLPYRDSLDTKPLGIYLFYRAVFELFGRFNMYAVHFATALVTFFCAYLLYRIFAVFKKSETGRWAALFFVVFSTTFIPKYVATSINSIMVFFLIASVYFMARAEREPSWHADFLAGFVLGIGFLFKYTAGIQLLLFFAFALFKDRHGKSLTMRSLTFGLAFLIPFAVHALSLYKLGVWDDFVQWSLLGSVRYISHGEATISFWQSFVIRFGTYVLATIFLWIFLIKGLNKRMFSDRLHTLFLLWFVLSLIPVCTGGRFYPHYFIHLLPSLCGLAAIGFLKSRVPSPGSRVIIRLAVLLVVLPALVFWVLRLDHRTYLTYFPDDELYEQQAIGKRLREISDPDDKLFVWGFATGIYFHSQLKAASRFLWTDLLTGRTPGPDYARVNRDQEFWFKNSVAWAAFWEDIHKNRPEYIVDTSPADIHDYGRFPLSRYARLSNYLTQKYEKIETVAGAEIYRRKSGTPLPDPVKRPGPHRALRPLPCGEERSGARERARCRFW